MGHQVAVDLRPTGQPGALSPHDFRYNDFSARP